MVFPRPPSSSRSPRSRYTFGLLILTAVTLLALDLPGTGPLQPIRNVLASAFRPVRSAGDAIFEPFSNGWRGAFDYSEVKDENDRLKAELQEARSDEAELARLRQELEEQRKLNGVTVVDVRTETGRVTSDPLSNLDPSIEIDVGSGRGVKEGMAVITGLTDGPGGGVLGRVVEAHAGRSKVELVTSPSFTVGASLTDGTRGVLRGQGRDKPLLIESVSPEAEVAEGDFVYTSGISDTAFPPDLVIGRVVGVEESANGLSQVVEVEPLADTSSVFVKVAIKDPPR